MKAQSWLRKNWLWTAGGAFALIHLSTWILQRVMKGSVRSEVEHNRKAADERTE